MCHVTVVWAWRLRVRSRDRALTNYSGLSQSVGHMTDYRMIYESRDTAWRSVT